MQKLTLKEERTLRGVGFWGRANRPYKVPNTEPSWGPSGIGRGRQAARPRGHTVDEQGRRERSLYWGDLEQRSDRRWHEFSRACSLLFWEEATRCMWGSRRGRGREIAATLARMTGTRATAVAAQRGLARISVITGIDAYLLSIYCVPEVLASTLPTLPHLTSQQTYRVNIILTFK